jgi:hypothetical protein
LLDTHVQDTRLAAANSSRQESAADKAALAAPPQPVPSFFTHHSTNHQRQHAFHTQRKGYGLAAAGFIPGVLGRRSSGPKLVQQPLQQR